MYIKSGKKKSTGGGGANVYLRGGGELFILYQLGTVE